MDLFIRLFKEIFYLSVMAGLLAILLLALKKVLHKALSPKWHYYVWIVLILRLILPFQPPSSLSIYTIFYNAAETANLPISAVAEPFQNPPRPETSNEATNHPPAGGGQGQNGTAGGPVNNGGTADLEKAPVDFIQVAAYAWLIGMGLLSLYTLGLNIAFAADVRRRYSPLRNERIQGILDGCKDALQIRRAIPLLTAKRPRTPSLYGLRSPKILISEASMDRLSDNEIRHVFLHELSHLKRKDIAVNWLMTLLQIVYFFNPLIWYAFYKIREDCEIACDAEALKYLKPEERQLYGGTIIKLIRLFSESNFIPVTAGISKNKSSVKRRILMIGNFKKHKWTGTLLAVIVIVTVALAGLTGCSKTVNNPPSPSDSPSGSPTASASPDASATPSDTAPETTAPGTDSPKPSEVPEPTAAPQPSQGVPSENPSPTAAPSANYFGQWTVNKVVAYGDAGTYSKEDAEKLVGKSLSFSKDEASIINDQPTGNATVLKNPTYQESVISKDDFLTYFRMSFDKLGIKTDSITEVSVSGTDAGGCTLLLKDANTIILAAGGTYFELVRA